MQKSDIIDKTVRSDDPDGPADVLQPYSYSDHEPDGDRDEREAIMAIDGNLEIPEFLKRTSGKAGLS